MAKSKTTIGFEVALKDLEGLVEKMEKGDLSLEASLTAFEQGVQLIRHCQDLLKNAEQRIHLFDKTENELKDFKQT